MRRHEGRYQAFSTCSATIIVQMFEEGMLIGDLGDVKSEMSNRVLNLLLSESMHGAVWSVSEALGIWGKAVQREILWGVEGYRKRGLDSGSF